jgi:hypothetical protein
MCQSSRLSVEASSGRLASAKVLWVFLSVACVILMVLRPVHAVEKYGSDMQPMEPCEVDAPEVVAAATVRVARGTPD